MGPLCGSVRASVEAMPWLKDYDQAAVDLALTYATRIDDALEAGDEYALTKALYLGPHLLRALGELGGTPAGRKALEIREETRGKLAELRAINGGTAPKPAKRRGKSA